MKGRSFVLIESKGNYPIYSISIRKDIASITNGWTMSASVRGQVWLWAEPGLFV